MYRTAKLIISLSRLLLYLFLLSGLCSSAITEGPVSVTTLEGLNAQFHCAGSGTVLVWEVDGLPSNDLSIENRGVNDNIVSSSGTVQSTLTVPATLVNNGTTVRCFIGPSLFNIAVVGNSSTLTIVTKIGPVLNLQFESSFSSILWDPPATAGVLNLLFSYNVIVTNMNTSEVIVSDTTTNTIYPLPQLKSCQYYTANVTVFYKDHFGDSVVTGQRVSSNEYFGLHKLFTTKIVRRDESHSAVTFSTDVQGNEISSCDQQFMAITYPIVNTTARTMHEEGSIATPGKKNFTVIVERGIDCVCLVEIVTMNNTIIDQASTNFSTFDVQSCVVSIYRTSLMVKCTFVVNSIEPGFVVLENLTSGETVWQQNYTEFVNITGLKAGKYNIFVYDNMRRGKPAYKKESLHVISNESGVNSDSSIAPTTTPTLLITTATDSSVVGIIAGCLAGIGVIIFMVSVAVGLVFLKSMKPKTAPMEEIDTNNIYSVAPSGTFTPIKCEENEMHERPQTHKNKNDPVYATLQLSSNRPTVPLSVGAVQYADIQQQPQLTKQGPVYADLHHSTNPPAPRLPVETVQYATTVQAQSNKEDSQNICAANTSDYASEETGSFASSVAKTEATSLTTLSSGQRSDPADADGSFIGESKDCTDNGNKTSMVHEQTSSVVEENVPADTRQHSGSSSLDTYLDTVPLMSSIVETKSDNPSISVYNTSKNSASKRNNRESSATGYSYISDGYKGEKTTHKGDRNYPYLRLRQCD